MGIVLRMRQQRRSVARKVAEFNATSRLEPSLRQNAPGCASQNELQEVRVAEAAHDDQICGVVGGMR
jgi:hypothetical protein